MLSILPAFSSPDLKVFLLPKKSFKSSAGGQTGPLRVPAARQCDLFRSASAALHKSHRLAYSRIKVASVVILSVGLCQSRKDRYLPLHPQCVRLLPRTHVLACSRFQKQFVIRLRGRQITSSTVEPKDILPLERLCVLDLHLPPEGHCLGIYILSGRTLSGPSFLPMCLRVVELNVF